LEVYLALFFSSAHYGINAKAAVNRVNTANWNLICIIGLILAHMILMPDRIDQTRQDLSKPCPGFFLCIALWLLLRGNTHRGWLAFFSRTRPKWNSYSLSFAAYPTAWGWGRLGGGFL
jgi:hypothetical protein